VYCSAASLANCSVKCVRVLLFERSLQAQWLLARTAVLFVRKPFTENRNLLHVVDLVLSGFIFHV
jgi:hypothetical protein